MVAPSFMSKPATVRIRNSKPDSIQPDQVMRRQLQSPTVIKKSAPPPLNPFKVKPLIQKKESTIPVSRSIRSEVISPPVPTSRRTPMTEKNNSIPTSSLHLQTTSTPPSTSNSPRRKSRRISGSISTLPTNKIISTSTGHTRVKSTSNIPTLKGKKVVELNNRATEVMSKGIKEELETKKIEFPSIEPVVVEESPLMEEVEKKAAPQEQSRSRLSISYRRRESWETVESTTTSRRPSNIPEPRIKSLQEESPGYNELQDQSLEFNNQSIDLSSSSFLLPQSTPSKSFLTSHEYLNSSLQQSQKQLLEMSLPARINGKHSSWETEDIEQDPIPIQNLITQPCMREHVQLKSLEEENELKMKFEALKKGYEVVYGHKEVSIHFSNLEGTVARELKEIQNQIAWVQSLFSLVNA